MTPTARTAQSKGTVPGNPPAKKRVAPRVSRSAAKQTAVAAEACLSKTGRAGDREAMIAEAAYFRALQRNFAPGYELEDWLEAEREIDVASQESASGSNA